MKIEEIVEIHRTYKEKIREEDYTNELNVDIWSASHQSLHWYGFVGTEADQYTFGEFTRRFERCKNELKELMKT